MREEGQEQGDKVQVIEKDYMLLHRPQSNAFDWFIGGREWCRVMGEAGVM